jgi:hypothetical protein
LEAALQGEVADETILVDAAALQTARDDLTTTSASRIGAVSLGTPHASGDELRAIRELLAGRTVSPELSMFVSTGRDVAADDREMIADLEAAGVVMVTDTCTYMTPILDPSIEVVMTDSAKWAFYAPGNIGVDVVFGSTPECVESAVAGTLIRDDGIWG